MPVLTYLNLHEAGLGTPKGGEEQLEPLAGLPSLQLAALLLLQDSRQDVSEQSIYLTVDMDAHKYDLVHDVLLYKDIMSAASCVATDQFLSEFITTFAFISRACRLYTSKCL